jgi:hypothetical protein
MSDLSKYRDRAAEALHRARHRGLSCLDGEDCIEADESDEAADALLAPGGVVAEIVAAAEESRRTAWAVHSEHVERMNHLRLHDMAVADERIGEAREQGAAEVRAWVERIHRPSVDHGEYRPYCLGCWEAGGEDGAPLWPCPTIRALADERGLA